jgi:hypothetical protein
MNWSTNIASGLIVLVAIIAMVGIAASVAIFVQIIRQGGWRLAEPAVIKDRWRMIRPWMLAGAVLGLLLGIAIVCISGFDETQSDTATESIVAPAIEVKSRPRDGARPAD